MIKRYLPSILLTLYLAVTYLPLFGEIDRIASQWVTLGLINFFSFIYLYIDKQISISIFNRFNFIYVLFIFSSLISLIFAINRVEGVIEITRHINIFFGILFFYKILTLVQNPSKRLINTILIFFIIQLLAVTNQFYFDLQPIGLTGNKNIVAASLSLQLPFIWIFFSRYNNIISKISFSLFLVYTYSCIILIGSKAAILSSTLITSIYFIYGLFIKSNKFNVRVFSSIAIVSLFLSFIITFNSDNNISVAVVNTINYKNDDGNLDRLRYYSETIQGFIESPLFGNGIGNWKILSIKYDAPFMKNYIVQYHAHNDFLQILAETGFLGFFFYSFFFLQIIFYSINKLFKNNNELILFPLLSFLVYIIDANLNFPVARVIMQINLILMFSFLMYILNESNEK